MAEQLLDRAQIRTAIQEVGREAVAQGMGRDPTGHADATHPRAQTPAHIAGAKPPPGAAQEQGSPIVGPVPSVRQRLTIDPRSTWLRLGEGGTSALQVMTQGPQCDLSRGHEAGLRTLSLDPQLLGFVIHVLHVQGHDLLSAQPACVGELEQSTIAYVQWSTSTAGRDTVEQASHFGRLQDLRQMRAATRGGQQIGWILLDQAVLSQAAKQSANRGKLARYRGGAQAQA